MADALLEVENIETCYGLSQVLFRLSLAIAPGEMVTLMGRNGMGKTTTVRSIMGLTPAMAGVPRPWRYGVLHLGGSPLSQAVLTALRERFGTEAVGDNQPYRMDDTDYTIPHHAVARGLDYVEIEVRQDLLADPAVVQAAAALLADVLPEALLRIS